MPRLARSDCAKPGITRVRSGRGFCYATETGGKLSDSETRERIDALAIPPAWTEVWICPRENGHLQATGVDAAGRKQYLYHEAWRAAKDREKFDEMLDFAAALPRLRARVSKDLRQRELTRERVLGCALRLLDLGFFRIGTEGYAEQNETFGLATIRRDHVQIEDGHAIFDYRAKSGKQRVQAISEPGVVRVIDAMLKRRGGSEELLAYKDGRRWRDVVSIDINDRIKELTGADYSAKDFRTWNGTVLAAVSLAAKRELVPTESKRKRAKSAACREVAYFLGNTPSVARSSYIDPRVFDRYDSGWTIAARVEELGGPEAFVDPERRVAIEDAVRDLIEDRKTASPALEKSPVKRA
ncbi:MAG: DNA topoisomerase IB [Solirubrobacterales bacterium]|nr:DNA topoisomerase IB [Solirubrobacterales bacterium]